MAAGNANGFLANAGITEIKGNPVDGWTLVTFDGRPIPAYPGLLTELIVDLRNVATAPQTGSYDLLQAVINGDPTAIGNALQTGLQNIGTTMAQFPGAVANDISDAVQRLSADVAAGATFSDAFGSDIIGLA